MSFSVSFIMICLVGAALIEAEAYVRRGTNERAGPTSDTNTGPLLRAKGVRA